MKTILFIALAFVAIFRPTLVMAAATTDAKTPPAPAAPASQKVDMTLTDLQVALIAINNAGAACDLGVKQLCPVVGARDATVAKLQGAYNALQGVKP